MIENLEKLIIQDGLQLEKIKAYIDQPNYLEILGISHRELQHSNFLAWIFDSKASHNAGNFFLKSFINTLPLDSSVKIKLNLSNLEGTNVLREYQDIDLLIVNESVGFTICIENKINADKSGGNQLIKYYEIVENTWTALSHQNIYVYLTPTPRTLTKEEIDINYVNITYREILEILEETRISINLAEYSIPLIENYIQNLRKNIMADSNEILLAQEIYRKHKKAIDFIVNNKPSLYSKELYNKINQYFIDHSEYENLTPKDKNIIRVLPKSISSHFALNSNSWQETSSIFALEIFCEQNKIWIKFCFGGIWNHDEERKSHIQKEKTNLFQKMKEFKSLVKYKVTRSKPESNYPSVANIDIVKITDKIVQEIDDKFEVFKKSFEKVETEVINDWIKEVNEKITKHNRVGASPAMADEKASHTTLPR